MKSLRVDTLLDPVPDADDKHEAQEKTASTYDPVIEGDLSMSDVLKTASVMEKLSRALETGQAKLDLELRDLFAGDDTDDDIATHNQIEDDYLRTTGQPGV